MLDMGSIRDIRKVIVSSCAAPIIVLFSDHHQCEIKNLAAHHIPCKPELHCRHPVSSTTELIKQFFIMFPREISVDFWNMSWRMAQLQALVFDKVPSRGADKMKPGPLECALWPCRIHPWQQITGARVRRWMDLRRKNWCPGCYDDARSRYWCRESVHVINCELPEDLPRPMYIASGAQEGLNKWHCFILCTEDETDYLKGIHQLTKIPMEVISRHLFSF